MVYNKYHKSTYSATFIFLKFLTICSKNLKMESKDSNSVSSSSVFDSVIAIAVVARDSNCEIMKVWAKLHGKCSSLSLSCCTLVSGSNCY